MPTTHTFVSLVMCDDCRREDNGKEILIGTYAGSMLVTTIPFVLPTFALRFEVIPHRSEYKRAVAVLVNPKGEEVFRLEATMGVARLDLPASFFLRASPVIIATTGDYKILLGMDEEPEEVGSLKIEQGHPLPTVMPVS
jgi:hypothetical protein